MLRGGEKGASVSSGYEARNRIKSRAFDSNALVFFSLPFALSESTFITLHLLVTFFHGDNRPRDVMMALKEVRFYTYILRTEDTVAKEKKILGVPQPLLFCDFMFAGSANTHGWLYRFFIVGYP